MGKGGGGSPTPTEQTSTNYTSSLPEYAEPYYKDLMERAQALTQEGYIPYEGPRIGEQSPFTQGSYDAVNAVAGSSLPYVQEAMNSTGLIGANVLNNLPGISPEYISGMIPGVAGVSAGYPGDVNYGGGMAYPGDVNYSDVGYPGDVNYNNIGQLSPVNYGGPIGYAGNVQYQQNVPWGGIGGLPGVNYSMIDPNDISQVNADDVFADNINADAMMVEAERFPQAELDAYMNPYTESVVQDVNDELWRQNLQEQAAIRNRMADSGAYGGSRQGLLESEQDRNYLSQAARTANEMYNQSFLQAQNQISTDQNRVLEGDLANQATALQGGLANQQAGLQAGLANQNASLQAAFANQDIGMRSALANQATGLSAGTTDAQLGLNRLLANQQTGLQAGMADQASSLQAGMANQQLGFNTLTANQQAALSAGMQNQQTDLQRLLSNQGTGLTAGLQNQQTAMQQYLANQQAGLTAGLANQQMGYQTGATNLDAALNAGMANQQWAGQTGLADQDALMQAQFANQASMLQGLTADQQANMQAQMSGLDAFLGSNQMALGAAQQLGGLGELYQNMGLTGATALGSAGADQELYRQALYDMAYQDFMNQTGYPYQQLQRYSSYMQGVPVGMNQEITGGSYQNPYAQLLGLGIGGLGTYNALSGMI